MDVAAWWNSLPPLALIPVTVLGVYAAVIALSRLNGLRSFSTMSAFDFAMTIAVGSVVATTILSPSASLLDGIIALASLFLLQRIVAWARRWPAFDWLVDNRPRILVQAGKVHDGNLRKCHMKPEDLRSKIREAGIPRLQDVALAVMETSGTVSVIRREGQAPLDDALYEDLLD